jgi:hypothetical protein
MIYVLKIIWDYRGAVIGTYRPQYRPLSAIRYLDANPLPTRYTLFSTLLAAVEAPLGRILSDFCNTLGVYHQLSSGFKLKHDRLVEMTMPKSNL